MVGVSIVSEHLVQEHTHKWWKHGTVYQVYPSSFKDSNGDGVGDIPGIISKLDYLKSVGIDIIWLSPHFKSPQKDMGYDISDYKDIYEKYGTLADCEMLIKECHSRGIKLIFDLVVNHTSDQHEWFMESRSSKTASKRDWYIWRPALYDGDGNRRPPNNWASYFGGSAWEWDESTQEYYLHLFCKEQPDLNWENLETRQAVYDNVILFWLDKGVDGFRIDTVEIYSKPKGLPDAPIADPDAEFQHPGVIVENGPQLHEILREMNSIGFSKYDTMTVGEGQTQSYKSILEYVSASRHELDMCFQFDLMRLGQNRTFYRLEPYSLHQLKDVTSKWQRLIVGTDGWTTSFLENHDGGRSVSRFLSDSPKYRQTCAKLLAVFLATLSGTLFIYQGQEIGMVNVPKDWPIEEYKDVESLNTYNMIKERTGGDPDALKQAMEWLQAIGRDNSRTPVQWDDSAHGGFTTGTPWMKVNPVYSEINVKRQEWDPYSPLSFWKHMIQFRRQNKDQIVYGEFETVDYHNDSVFSYTKSSGNKKFLVALNFTATEQQYSIKDYNFILSSVNHHVPGTLQPYEAMIYESR
jgi:oligo-1,6-glucosidase